MKSSEDTKDEKIKDLQEKLEDLEGIQEKVCNLSGAWQLKLK